ncbi:hypothetical protein [Pseudomonas sp. KNUC1026]|uniref:hypothetical protein n=1 Tax=Pseudomonas sp. KNUC1026 TaxID=2893890 RepID=UPI001F32343F|nr:hypothetical protein [Pseudomonas sp. KNUC1026]UFH51352.1 hypothetical protein LN139_10265 [Pseudomonas sp. KNUC1026]
MRLLNLLLASLALCLATTAHARSSNPTDDEIAQQLIDQSIAQYPGNCPCPYNLASNGSRCGKRSAYSRPGGRAPLCFREDVSSQAIERVRQSLKTRLQP